MTINTTTNAIKDLQRAEDGPADPFALFAAWMNDAKAAEVNDPDAMSLATVDPDGRPSNRMVLLKHYGPDGFVFFTNRESRKGMALAAHPLAALCLHWKSLRRSVRIEGSVTQAADAASDDYFATRSAGSRIGALASDQSRPLSDRATLENRVADLTARYGDNPPRPPHWGGYVVTPDSIEFWQDGTHRLHTRLVFHRDGDAWTRLLLNP